MRGFLLSYDGVLKESSTSGELVILIFQMIFHWFSNGNLVIDEEVFTYGDRVSLLTLQRKTFSKGVMLLS